MSQYVCENCGFGSASWYGKCPECHQWSTFKKFSTGTKKSTGRDGVEKKATFSTLKTRTKQSSKRIPTDVHECDRVLGGGFIEGEVILIAGAPGVGKSTLLLKILSHLRTVYVSGEESGEQILQRAERLQVDTSKLLFSSDNEVMGILSALQDNAGDYDVVVIDSIQTVYSSSIEASMGSVSQIKESASKIVEWAKRNHTIVIIVGHITKDGDIAGPKTLEHLVDCVLYLEGEPQSSFRILRAHKNRFGATDEVGIFEMKETGIEEVDKPSVLIDPATQYESGRALVATIEGSRPLFYEVQSLVVPSALTIPRRVVTGVDSNRLQLLLAVMRRHMGVKLDTYDVYVNIVGGLSARTPSADLGIIASILSAVEDKPLQAGTVFIGEVGLLGEVRAVQGQHKVLDNISRFGLKKAFSSVDIQTVKRIKSLVW